MRITNSRCKKKKTVSVRFTGTGTGVYSLILSFSFRLAHVVKKGGALAAKALAALRMERRRGDALAILGV